MRRISLLAQKNAPLRLAFAPGRAAVSAQTPDIGEAHETLPSRSTASRSRSASTPSSCATGSRASSRRRVVLSLTSPLRPGLIESADESGFVYLVMPIRLGT